MEVKEKGIWEPGMPEEPSVQNQLTLAYRGSHRLQQQSGGLYGSDLGPQHIHYG